MAIASQSPLPNLQPQPGTRDAPSRGMYSLVASSGVKAVVVAVVAVGTRVKAVRAEGSVANVMMHARSANSAKRPSASPVSRNSRVKAAASVANGPNRLVSNRARRSKSVGNGSPGASEPLKRRLLRRW